MGSICSADVKRVRVLPPKIEAKTVQSDTIYNTTINEAIHHRPGGINSHIIVESNGQYKTKDDIIISPYCQLNNYTIFTPPLGVGATSTVYLCQDQYSKGVFAIKVVDRHKFFNFTYKLESMEGSSIDREIAILKKIDFPYLIKLYEIYEYPDDDLLFLIFSYVDGCSITTTNDTDTFLLPKVKRYMTQLLLSVNYLHQNHIVHRDIKVENLLHHIGSDSVILCDFGLSHIFNENDLLESSCGTRYYQSPEIVLSKRKPYSGRSADIWACGIVMYRLLFGKVPFKGETTRATNLMVLKNPLLIPVRVDPECLNLLKSMLEKNPAKRLTAQQCLQHPWILRDNDVPIDSIKYEDIYNTVSDENVAKGIETVSFFTVSLLKLKLSKKLAKMRHLVTNPNQILPMNSVDVNQGSKLGLYEHSSDSNYDDMDSPFSEGEVIYL